MTRPSSLSGCTVIRNGVRLRYPFRASIESYAALCDEIIIAFDPTSDDTTSNLVSALARDYPHIRLLESPWSTSNHLEGSEIAIQSNFALNNCQGDWTIYIQADEAIHEGDHDAIKAILDDPEAIAALFDRRSFLHSLDRDIPEYYAQGLLRLFRTGLAFSVGDAMSCRLVQHARGRIAQSGLRLFNYSRMGDSEEIAVRARALHTLYHTDAAAIERNIRNEGTQRCIPFPPAGHPESMKRFYHDFNNRSARSLPPQIEANLSTSQASQLPLKKPPIPVTLAVLMGNGETDRIVPLIWSFRNWPGELVFIDDMTNPSNEGRIRTAAAMIGIQSERLIIHRHALSGDFARARNRAHEVSSASWILHVDCDEAWDPGLMSHIVAMTAQLEHERKSVCGFPRANILNGIVINDIPDSQWSEAGLNNVNITATWPPYNHDYQFRLMKRTVRWIGAIHEHPEPLDIAPHDVVVLHEPWILHAKSLDRQRHQDSYYRSLGQKVGMPQSISMHGDAGHKIQAVAASPSLRIQSRS